LYFDALSAFTNVYVYYATYTKYAKIGYVKYILQKIELNTYDTYA